MKTSTLLSTSVSRIQQAANIGILFIAAVLICTAPTGYGAEFKAPDQSSRGFGLMSQECYLFQNHGQVSLTRTWHTGTPIPEPPWAPTPYMSPTYVVEVFKETPELIQWSTSINYDFDSDDVYPVPTLAARYQPFLRPEPQIQSDDPTIRAIAAKVTAGCHWQSDAVVAIQIWMSTHISYNDSLSGNEDALTVLKRRTGICYGYSTLAVALCRAAGIPAAIYAGIAMWANMDHAWIVVFYPRTGWLFTEPQGTANTVGYGHILDWPPRPVGLQTLSGEVINRRVNNSTDQQILIDVTDGNPHNVMAASARHVAAVSSHVGEAHVEIWPPSEPYAAEGLSAVARAWVSGNSNLVWAVMTINGQAVKKGPPPDVLRCQPLGGWSFKMGENIIAVRAEDIDGNAFTAKKTFQVTLGPRIWVERWQQNRLAFRFPIPLGMYGELEYSTDLKNWSRQIDSFWGEPYDYRATNSLGLYVCIPEKDIPSMFWRIVFRKN